jgi:deoxyribonuclease-2
MLWEVEAMLSAIDDNGKPIDWWFMYKFPAGLEPKGKPKTQGNEYLYYDPNPQRPPNVSPLYLSPHRLGTGPQGAFYHTLQQLYANPDLNSTGWIFYNDEYPEDMSPFNRDPRVKEAKEQFGDNDQQLKKALVPIVKDIQETLIAEWKQHKSDWPPNVQPKINRGDLGKKHADDRGQPSDHAQNGHCKGVLAFDLDSDTAFWLSHSTPRIPPLYEPADQRFFYPSYAYQYAQTFICITLRDVKTACQIAKYLALQHEPQVFGCHLPQRLPDGEAIKKKWKIKRADEWKFQRKNEFWLWKLAQGSIPPSYHDNDAFSWWPSDAVFRSKQGKAFRMIAKSGAWYGNFWIDLVGPHLGVDLRVESWRRLTATAGLPVDDVDLDGVAGVKLDKKKKVVATDEGDFGSGDWTDVKGHHHEARDADALHVVDEVVTIDLESLTDSTGQPLGKGRAWHYTKDHAKWAISVDEPARGSDTLDDRAGRQDDWICVADINRMASQERRGGGAICFHEPDLWHGLDAIERIGEERTKEDRI